MGKRIMTPSLEIFGEVERGARWLADIEHNYFVIKDQERLCRGKDEDRKV